MKKLIRPICTIAALCLSTSIMALSAGKLEVLSGINQPFHGKVTLYNVGFLDKDTIKVHLADQSQFDLLNTERKHLLTELKFNPVLNGEQSFIDIKGRQPVKESYIDFIIEIKWPQGHIIRPYTALLPIPETH
ncbi:hypothetical protein EDC56_0363 [Sinobacterium caligoides]|uniref:FimV N-terminal domain-containing protein n=1 Tax=Sinobacterium caligoides TaxID=933926 RepID=A0A3N2DZI7_9GAMM|nr:hypothetical protein [Sinobacterium caligoides]ROS04849.1 hypothetical protein EDC56_0363 [Sinobacterium caligoides]